MPPEKFTNDPEANPYLAPGKVDGPTERNTRLPRSWLLRGVVLFQVLFYAVFVLFFAFVGIVTLSVAPITARMDEIVLMLIAVAACPFVAWFMMLEIRGLLYTVVERERLLSAFSMLSTIVPVGLSAFWFYEYLAFGSFGANAVPGVFALLFATFWFAVSFGRWKATGR